MKRIIVAATAVFALAACQTSYDKTKSGLTYKIFPGKGGDSLTAGKFVKFNIAFTIPDKKDTVLSSTFGKTPGYIQIDTSRRAEYSFMEVMSKCMVGDSAVVVLSIDSLKSKGAIQDYNETFVKGGTIMCRFKIIQTFKTEADVTADYQKEMDLENKRLDKSLEDYIAKNNIKAIKLNGGGYVAVENAGDTTLRPDSTTTASVKYKGYLQENGKVFDTNFDTSKGHAELLPVTIGRSNIIPIWGEALPYLGKGGSGKILVPAYLGYGPNGSPPDIPGNANIIFDIQVVDVKPAPPMPVGPAGRRVMPGINDNER
ncbi:MAG TPA: FKBP-type peptidyl-prolyl cis-trans isomerase [Panacibacter sp.]|nr:FKBP-type peptidyl-prolyl cis-trans isomerase [Panacibacter sp.]HNP43676.1 FKBP-type peptidyl-prolyl cis-trans isomerase [Panacibacter sp.]